VCERRIDQARLIGVSRLRAMELSQAGARAVPIGTVVLWSVLAATSVAPAIILARPATGWGVGPAVVMNAGGSADSRREAAALALAAMALNITALAVAMTRRHVAARGVCEVPDPV
jgi:hypothetical protein